MQNKTKKNSLFTEIENLLNEIIIEGLDYNRKNDISLKWNN